MNWRAKVLRDLWAGSEVVLLRREFDAAALRELIDLGVFRLGLLPEDGAELLLEGEGGKPGWFNVLPKGASFACYENTDVAPRTMTVGGEELRFCHLNRTGFYALVAEELGCRPHVQELSRGIWCLGKKAIPGRGNAFVLVGEPGVRAADIAITLAGLQYKVYVLLSPQEPINEPPQGERTLICGGLAIHRADGTFRSSALEDMADLELPHPCAPHIDCGGPVPKLVVGSTEVALLVQQGAPTDGVRYLEHLMDHPDTPHSCWDLYCHLRPALKDEVDGPEWNDPALDDQARRELAETLRAKRAELHEAEDDPSIPEDEVRSLRSDVEDLEQRWRKDVGLGGRSRTIKPGDRELLRQKVRKALGKVIAHVRQRHPQIGDQLAGALGKGDPVTFNTPPDWRT